MKYYSLEPALSRGCKLNFIIGHRSAGKTYAFKEWAIITWLKTGAEWVYVRRLEDELNSVKHNLWDDISHKYGLEVKSKGSLCLIREKAPEDLEGKELKEWNSENPWKSFGYYIPLSKQQNFKSGSYPKVDKICFDEFIIENTSRRYLPNEVDQFLSLIFTISRDRPVKTVCLSNSGFISNPYFGAYNIKSSDFSNASFLRRNNGNVLFEYYTSEENLKELSKSSIAKISGDSYKEYALENKFMDGGNALISEKPAGATVWMKFTKDGKRWVTMYYKKGSNWWMTEKNTETKLAYCLDRWGTIEGTKYDARVMRNLKALLDNRMISFSSPDSRELFLNWMKNE